MSCCLGSLKCTGMMASNPGVLGPERAERLPCLVCVQLLLEVDVQGLVPVLENAAQLVDAHVAVQVPLRPSVVPPGHRSEEVAGCKLAVLDVLLP